MAFNIQPNQKEAPIKTEKTYFIGSFFKDKKQDNVYILSLVGKNSVALVCLDDGKTWNFTLTVASETEITDTELKKLTVGAQARFVNISKEYAIDLLQGV